MSSVQLLTDLQKCSTDHLIYSACNASLGSLYSLTKKLREAADAQKKRPSRNLQKGPFRIY